MWLFHGCSAAQMAAVKPPIPSAQFVEVEGKSVELLSTKKRGPMRNALFNRQIINPRAGLGTITLLFALFPALIGCAVKTPDQLAELPVILPERFSLQGQQYDGGDWWLALGDKPLEILIGRALSGNQGLKAYAERLVQAEALARKAGAELTPTLDLEGMAKSSRARTNGTTGTTDSLLLGLAASFEIDLWGRLRAREDAALLDVKASREDLRTGELSLVAQIAHVWYQLAASYGQLDLLLQQQKVNELGLELVQLRFNAGQIGIADLLQQRQLIESKNGELAQQRAAAKALENQLAVLAGVSPGKFEIPGRPELIELPPLPDPGVPADLLVRRPDVRSSYFALAAADRRAAAALADRYPRLSISADLNTSGAKAGDLFDNWLASLAANLVGPLFDGGSRQAEAERSLAATREKLHLFGEALLSAVEEVEDALVKEKEQRLLIRSLELQLDLADRTVSSLRDRYKQGTVDYQRILTALLSQQSLQRSLVTSRQQLIGYRIDLYRALGGSVPVGDPAVSLPESWLTARN